MAYIRESNPSAKFVLGGPFVVSMYKAILEHDPNIDAAVLYAQVMTLQCLCSPLFLNSH